MEVSSDLPPSQDPLVALGRVLPAVLKVVGNDPAGKGATALVKLLQDLAARAADRAAEESAAGDESGAARVANPKRPLSDCSFVSLSVPPPGAQGIRDDEVARLTVLALADPLFVPRVVAPRLGPNALASDAARAASVP